MAKVFPQTPASAPKKLEFDTIWDTTEAFSMFYASFKSSLLFSLSHDQVFSLLNDLLSLPPYTSTEKGQFIVVLDSQDRENEGDLIIAAESVTTDQMAFMIHHTRSAFLRAPRHLGLLIKPSLC